MRIPPPAQVGAKAVLAVGAFDNYVISLSDAVSKGNGERFTDPDKG
jgi:hypothetical protein